MTSIKKNDFDQSFKFVSLPCSADVETAIRVAVLHSHFMKLLFFSLGVFIAFGGAALAIFHTFKLLLMALLFVMGIVTALLSFPRLPALEKMRDRLSKSKEFILDERALHGPQGKSWQWKKFKHLNICGNTVMLRFESDTVFMFLNTLSSEEKKDIKNRLCELKFL